jgi:hypothetical protein
MAVSHRMYARSLFQAARDSEYEEIPDNCRDFPGAIGGTRAARFARTRSSARRALLCEIPPTRRARAQLRPPPLGEGPTGRSRPKEFGRRRAGRLTVELTTAYELSDDEAASIVKKTEQSSAAPSTRAVDRRSAACPPGRLAPARRHARPHHR